MAAGRRVRQAHQMQLLCGLDESAPGRNAASVAATLARRLGAGLTLMHVMRPGDDEDAARERLAGIAHDVSQRADVPADLRIEPGRPAERLQAAARELGCDLIVIGHARRGPFADVLFGEVHEPLLRTGSVPVVLVPAGASVDPGERIVLACRASAVPQRAAEVAGRLAGALDVPVVITQVLPDAGARPTSWQVYDAARRDGRAATQAGGDGVEVEFAEYDGAPGPELARALAALDASLLVVGERRRGRWTRLLRPSVASVAARQARHPVVVVPAG
jgi:nucleotide-binding universal stress UspA family protein